jgi:Immunity protein 63
VIDAPANELVSFDPHIDMGAPYIWVELGGPYHWIVKERGQTLDHRTTIDPDEILFWSFEATTGSKASRWAAQHPDDRQDFRVGMWAN